LMALEHDGDGCFFCFRKDGHDPVCDFHSQWWDDPQTTSYSLEGQGLPDAWEDGTVCDGCGGTFPGHEDSCPTQQFDGCRWRRRDSERRATAAVPPCATADPEAHPNPAICAGARAIMRK
jgi:hypothetical protein